MGTAEHADDVPLAPEDRRCTACGGEGWLWQAPAVTVPPQLPAWQSCRPCNRTGLSNWMNRTPQRAKPMRSPDEDLTEAAQLIRFQLDQAGQLGDISQPDTWRAIGIDVQLDNHWIIRLRLRGSAAQIEVFYRDEPRKASETLPIRTTPHGIATRAQELYLAALDGAQG